MVKRILISICVIVGALFIAEIMMPGHLDRLTTYLEGNIDALTAWIE